MRTPAKLLRFGTLGGSLLSVAVLAGCTSSSAEGGAAAGTLVDPDHIGGVVLGANGPEAGVWVIAETTDLPTKLAKIVVTDDAGRYVVPDLPPASYEVWVRGYRLVDSARVPAEPGDSVDLTAVPAPDERAAARY